MELDIGVTHSDFSLDEYWLASNTSSGYLEDAITGWDIWCKQHNLPSKEDQLLEDHKKSSPSSSQNHAVKHESPPQRSYCASKESDENDASISRGQWKKIAYPFELVKPGGVEGKEVAALTRIQTRGRGSITIIRTKG
ncbi:uncharacterized protein LOC131622081 isoform X3 [Vicia villosa]|uniref:uncharacterized protein LOC131622081 isoform X3 n=1 Tax=Vicia villosa TaxID=3911 RepID=UPI00273C5917|nr:uncharacterized protein LOC131622081 isoform X3 [Vicia villosa]